jgi:hypothetical protein
LAQRPANRAKSATDIRVSFSESGLGRYVGLGTQARTLIYSAAPPMQQKLDLTAAQKVD